MAESVVTLPSASDVLLFLGWAGADHNLTVQAQAHIEAITAAARAYCRGRGFPDAYHVAADIYGVIISAAARSLNNPTHAVRIEAGSFNTVPGSAASFSLMETTTLNRYRTRAA